MLVATPTYQLISTHQSRLIAVINSDNLANTFVSLSFTSNHNYSLPQPTGRPLKATDQSIVVLEDKSQQLIVITGCSMLSYEMLLSFLFEFQGFKIEEFHIS